MPDYVSEFDFGDGVRRQVRAAQSGITAIQYNGVSQTVTSGNAEIDGETNFLTETTWTTIQSILQ